MRSSIITFIFSLALSLIVSAYVSHLIVLKKGIHRNNKILEREFSNRDFLELLSGIFKQKDEIDYTLLLDSLKKYETDNIVINLADISSTLNPNFMDFTLFKYPPLRTLLAENVTWRTLNDYREEIGFITDITKYDKFFKQGNNIFSIYSLPNINNAADWILKEHYHNYTGNEFKAIIFKDLIVSKRLSQELLDEKSYKELLRSFDKDIQKTLDVIPSWNVNFVPEVVLRTVLSKNYRGQKISSYNSKINTIIQTRKRKLITKEELSNILQIREKEKAALTYLGVQTTFWQIEVIDKKSQIKTIFIYGWSIDHYRLISLKTELL